MEAGIHKQPGLGGSGTSSSSGHPAFPVSAVGLHRLPRAGSCLPVAPYACWPLQSAGGVDLGVHSACPRFTGVRGRREWRRACALAQPFRLGEGVREEGLGYDSSSYQTNTKIIIAQE